MSGFTATPYVPGAPLRELPYISTNVRFRETEFLDYVNSIIININILIKIINQLLPTVYNTSWELPTFGKIEAQRTISAMHDALCTMEQAILSLNKGSASLNESMTYIDELIGDVEIPPTEMNEAVFQEGGPLNHVAEDLNQLNQGILQYNMYLYRLEAFLHGNYTNWQDLPSYLQKTCGPEPKLTPTQKVGAVCLIVGLCLALYIQNKT